MYEETKSSIDWKGIFLKVIIGVLLVFIALKGYSILKDNKKTNSNNINTTTETVAESKSSSTFTANMEKLRDAGEKYFKDNKDKLPKTEGTTSMVTLKELIDNKSIDTLSDEEGKTCDTESSYVTASLEGKKTKIKANLVCGSSSSYSLVYMGENDSTTKTETKETTTNNGNTITKTETKTETNKNTTSSNNCGTSCAVPTITVENKVENTVTINKDKKEETSNKTEDKTPSKNTSTSQSSTTKTKYYTVTFNSNGGSTSYADQIVKKGEKATYPGTVAKYGYYFQGWYLNGVKYDFNQPVTKDIELIAEYSYSSNNGYYNNHNNNYNYGYQTTLTKSLRTFVYTMAWDKSYEENITVEHTLRVPEDIKEMADRYNWTIDSIRIKNISYNAPITTQPNLNKWDNNHEATFLYEIDKKWDANYRRNINVNSLSRVTRTDVDLDLLDTEEKSYRDAMNNGFDVRWETDNITETCERPFTLNGVSDLCAYGFSYYVDWEYEVYNY